MSRARVTILGLALGLGGGLDVATAEPAAPLDPCVDAIIDPVPTPVREVAIDAQRSACLRDELGAHVLVGALVDNPGFRGVLGGDLRLLGRMRIAHTFELDIGARLLRATYVQNAVNKVTAVELGPVTLGGAWAGDLGDGARVALAGTLELPYTRDDIETMHVAGDLAGVVTAALTPRTVLHARLGMLAMYASSSGGSTSRFALRSGADLARRIGPVLVVHAGADVQAGWYAGLDHVNLRVGAQFRFGGPWRGMVGVGVPVVGEERTNALLDLGIVRDLW